MKRVMEGVGEEGSGERQCGVDDVGVEGGWWVGTDGVIPRQPMRIENQAGGSSV